jgi:ATP-dependent RNA helicase RhlE
VRRIGVRSPDVAPEGSYLNGVLLTDYPAEAGFSSLGLSAQSLGALEQVGYREPTPIQRGAIPAALAGRDVIGCAATGTGKTAAFVLPLIERLRAIPGGTTTRGLVLAPTRELVEQTGEQLEIFGRASGIRCVTIIGGVSMGPQQAALRRPHDVVVATPGRLLDHMERRDARLGGIQILVLDEADRMLDMGFRHQLNRILAAVPRQRQTMLFSATMAGEVADFASRHLHQPARIEIARSGTTAARAEQKVYLCGQDEKAALLLALLSLDRDSTLVFTRTKHRADKVARLIERAGHAVSRIHGNRSQEQRRASLEGFKSGEHRVLVATDIAARGIDVEAIGHVILFDLPHVPEDYVHRVGRTARASAAGRASSFCAPEESDLLRGIERLLHKALPRADVPRDLPAFQEARRMPPEKMVHARRADPRRRNHPGRGAGSGGGGGGKKQARGRSGPTSGTWRPKRR